MIVTHRRPPEPPENSHGPRKRGWAAEAIGEARNSGPGTHRAVAKRRSGAPPGLPGPRAGPGGSAAHSRVREATSNAAAQRRPQQPAAQPLRTKAGTPSGADGSAASNRASSAGRQLSSAPKPGAPPGCAAGAPRGRDQAPHPAGLQPAVCVISPAPFRRGVAGRSPAEGVWQDRRGPAIRGRLSPPSALSSSPADTSGKIAVCYAGVNNVRDLAGYAVLRGP